VVEIEGVCPSAVRSLRRPLLAVALAGVAYLVLGLVLARSGPHLLVHAAPALTIGGVGVAVVSRARRMTAAARRSWLCLGFAALLWAAGQTAHVAIEQTAGASHAGTADLAFLGVVVLLVVGTLLHPSIAASALSLVRSVLDGVIIVSSFLLFMTAMASVADPSGRSVTLSLLLELVYVVDDIVVVAVVLVGLSRMQQGRRASIALLLAALACAVVGTDTYERGWPFDTGWLLGFLLLWAASGAPGAQLRRSGPDDRAEPSPRQVLLRRVIGVLPYASVGVVMVAGGIIYFREQFTLTSAHTVAALVMIGAMIARQSVSVLDASSAARELARGEAYFRSIVQGSSDVTTIVDEGLVVVWQSPSVRTVFGLNERAAVGKPIRNLIHPEDRPRFDEALRRVVDGPGPQPRTASLRARTRDADRRWHEIETNFANHLDTPAIRGIVFHTRDISERSGLEQRLREMAFTDALTSLPNRRHFLDRLDRAGVRLASRGETYTVLAVDLDGFKAVNDLHGHGAGDALLVEVAARLRAEVRDTDTVARLGGDEFAILVREGAAAGQRLAERLVDTVGAPYILDRVTAHVSVSVGVAEAQRGDDGAVVLRNADLALRHAKQTGKKHAEVYLPALHQGALERLAVEHDLAGALGRGEIRMAYQPIFDLARGVIVGAEALMRWRHPVRGEVSPGVFVPVAEDSGQIVELGRWALGESARQLAAWDAAGHSLQMGVNVSTRQLRGSPERGWPLRDDVAGACADAGIPASRLVLEITESAFLHSFDTALVELEALRALGAHIALDDFGTGYSSLSYLRRLPVDILKIDREFVSGMTTEDHVAALAELVVRLGERLGMEIVAEGIETAAEAAGVLEIGCVLGQGFHLGRPSSPAEFDALLAVTPAVPAGTGEAVPGVTV
jgi:diguanylate cyclase (GGDEF)-like protein/PAS domain S-box-containing protein